MRGLLPQGLLRRRILIAWAIAVLAVIFYVLLLRAFDVAATPTERQFGTGGEDGHRLRIYLEPLAADPVNDALQIRVSVAPDKALHGARPDLPDRDVKLVLSHGDTVREIILHAYQAIPSTTLDVDLEEGSISAYPLDHYTAGLRLQTLEGAEAQPASGPGLPSVVTVWGGMLGYAVATTEENPGTQGDISLRFHLRRTGAMAVFALAAYGAMAVIAATSLTIGFSVFLGRRRPESGLTGALGAMVFALPTLRNALPGAPPLGVRADLVIFLWAELAVVLSLALFVLTWFEEPRRP